MLSQTTESPPRHRARPGLSAADRGGAVEWFCAGCEAIVTATDGCCECPTWGTINRELRQGRELPLLSLPLLSLPLLSLLSLQMQLMSLQLLSLQLA
jgi:hypothetical protein